MHHYQKIQTNRIKLTDFLDKYDFDYLLVESRDRQLYDMQNDNYKVIYEYTDNQDTNNGIKVYKKAELPND